MQTNKSLSTYRKKAAVCAGVVAAMAAFPALAFTHGHHVLGFTFIGPQVVLLVIAMRFVVLARQERND